MVKRIPYSKFYSFSVTINNPLPNEADQTVFETHKKSGKILHYIVGYENYDEPNKTRHLQCAVCFKRAIRWKAVKRLFIRAHVEPVKTNYPVAVRYCKKDGFFVESGLYREAVLMDKKMDPLTRSRLISRSDRLVDSINESIDIEGF